MTKINSLLKYAEDFSSLFTDPLIIANVGYVDTKISALGSPLNLKGALDASSGAITAPATGAAGDTWYVTGAPIGGASFMGSTFRSGDAIVVCAAYPSSPAAANFIFLEKNDDLATTAIAGLIQIATQAIVNTGTDNTQAVTALSLAGMLANGLYARKFSATNPLLNKVTNTCVWTITNTLGSMDVHVQIIEVATGLVVIAKTNITAANITVTFNSNGDIAAGTYKMVGIGI
ncbi:MAG TPA: hypothetical protein VNW99_08550 [Cytophagaceae bacterium]|jgi:hypothetical protein|nr:hypothetical protein [Cytophagaceae bacterium]